VRAIVVRPPTPGAELRDVPGPAPVPGGVRVSVLECGVCGTDRDIAAGKYGQAPAGEPFLILGHENLGRVAEVAPGVPDLAPGDLVVATVRRGCGRCRFCAVGRSDFCETGQYTERGIAGAPGYWADEYVERPEFLVPVPPGQAGYAVLLEPLSVVEKAIAQGEAVLRRKEPTPGHPAAGPGAALVAGTGAVGMLAVLALRIRGYAVTAIDRHGGTTAAASLLKTVGADHVDVGAGLAALQGREFDLIVEAAGSTSLPFALVDRLGRNGVLVLTGIPAGGLPPAPLGEGDLLREVVLGNRAVVGSVNASRGDFEVGLRDLASFEARWPGSASGLITERRPLEDAPAVVADRAPGSIKTVLRVAAGASAAAR
jgi:glucose 1-dehydrogenase